MPSCSKSRNRTCSVSTLIPFVAQTCLCLSRYVQETWFKQDSPKPSFQSFLANSFDEAVSGAIKLARYAADIRGKSLAGLVIDCENRLGPFPPR